jgi:hypothetical protein
MMPRKPASRKKAVNTSYANSGPLTAPATREKHAHPEAYSEDFRPKEKQFAVDRLPGAQPKPFEHNQVTCQTNAYRRKNNVERDRKCELQSREQKGIGGRLHGLDSIFVRQ